MAVQNEILFKQQITVPEVFQSDVSGEGAQISGRPRHRTPASPGELITRMAVIVEFDPETYAELFQTS
ncbi:hypothetical protein ACNUI4_15870 [Pseudomonas aeruginosa]